MINYNTFHGGSNPYNIQLKHIFTMLTNWKQIECILLPNIIQARKEDKEDKESSTSNNNNNVYESIDATKVMDAINFRLNLPIHKCTTISSTMNTLKYLFFHMKCGIFVMIKNGKLRIFAPFVNSDYRNTWGDVIKLEGDDTLGMVLLYYIFLYYGMCSFIFIIILIIQLSFFVHIRYIL